MEKIIQLSGHSISPQIKELHLFKHIGDDYGLYKIYTKWPDCPSLDGYKLINFKPSQIIDGHAEIISVDFDGGPYLTKGYKIGDDCVIEGIFSANLKEKGEEILFLVKKLFYDKDTLLL